MTTTNEPIEYYYRMEDADYSVSDEYGDHAYTSRGVRMIKYPVLRHTKCGVWLDLGFFIMSRRKWEEVPPSHRRFVNREHTKQFALPTAELAYKSYLARKNKQIRLYENKIQAAHMHIEAAHRHFEGKTRWTTRHLT